MRSIASTKTAQDANVFCCNQTPIKGVHQHQGAKTGSFGFLNDGESSKKGYAQMLVLTRPLRYLGWELFKFELSARKRVVRQNCLRIILGRDDENTCESSFDIL